MRIAYLCCDFGIPIHGSKGASIHVRELSQALQDLGHEVLILSPRAGGPPPADFTVPVHEHPLPKRDKAVYRLLCDDPRGGEWTAKEVRGLLYAAELRRHGARLLREFAPDLIYERHALFATAGADLARALDVPRIVEVNAPLSEEQAAHRGLTFARTARALEQATLTAADQVIAVSAALAPWLTALGVDRERITVLPNAVAVDRFADLDAARDAVRAGLGLAAPDQPVVGFLGTLKPWHGTATLIRAVGRLHRAGAGPLPHLLIVGDGPERANLEALAREEGIAARTTFTGAVPHQRVPAYVAAMDIATAPYDRAEGCYFSPLKLFEYLAAARPTVAADVGQLRDCLRHGETGWLYPPGDVPALAAALAALLADPARAAALGRAGRDYVRAHHTWAGNARTVIALAEASRAPAGRAR